MDGLKAIKNRKCGQNTSLSVRLIRRTKGGKEKTLFLTLPVRSLRLSKPYFFKQTGLNIAFRPVFMDMRAVYSQRRFLSSLLFFSTSSVCIHRRDIVMALCHYPFCHPPFEMSSSREGILCRRVLRAFLPSPEAGKPPAKSLPDTHHPSAGPHHQPHGRIKQQQKYDQHQHPLQIQRSQ